MSKSNPLLPGGDVTIRVIRDDGFTYAGVTISPLVYTPDGGRAQLASATGLSVTEIARAYATPPRTARVVRQPILEGIGWLTIFSTMGVSFYLQRDDGSHLSWDAPESYFTIGRAASALATILTLTATEQARLTDAAGASVLFIPALALLSPIDFRVLLSPIDGRILLRAA